MSTNAYFCRATGVRIAGPGVSKQVDPVKGQELAEPPQEPGGHVDDLDKAHRFITTLEEQIEINAALAGKEMEALKAAHAAELEQERAARQAELGALKAAHAAELEQLTKPVDVEAPTAPDRTVPATKKIK